MSKKKSSFKFIHVADLHLGRKISVGDKSSKKENSEYFSLIDEDARKTAFEAPLTALENLVKVAIENKVDFIVILVIFLISMKTLDRITNILSKNLLSCLWKI